MYIEVQVGGRLGRVAYEAMWVRSDSVRYVNGYIRTWL